MKKSYIFEIWHSKQGSDTEKCNQTFQTLIENFQSPNIENLNLDNLRNQVNYICKKIATYWKKSHRVKSRFLDITSSWLEESVTIILQNVEKSKKELKRGRPKKKFSECSKRTKQRKLADLKKIDENTIDTLRDSSFNSATDLSPVAISANEVLSLFVEAKLTKHQYLLIKEFLNNRLSSNILPSYQKLLKAKKSVTPKKKK